MATLVITAEAVLSFVGLGVQPPAPSWGTMLNAAPQFLDSAPWMAFWPGLAIFLLALALQPCRRRPPGRAGSERLLMI